MNSIELTDYNKQDDIFDASVPGWLKKEMERVAQIEKCHIRDLRYKREFYFDPENLGWTDIGEIIYNL